MQEIDSLFPCLFRIAALAVGGVRRQVYVARVIDDHHGRVLDEHVFQHPAIQIDDGALAGNQAAAR